MKKMRRGFALAMASAMVLLTACGGSQGASGSAAPADTQATQAPEAGKDTGAAADTTAAAASGDVIKIGCPQPPDRNQRPGRRYHRKGGPAGG